MSFRKRNVIISQKGDGATAAAAAAAVTPKQAAPGVRPSPVTGHATTSTGTESLDKLLGLGAGLALGTSLIIEEEGTTEFARSLLSCHAAEGVMQRHTVLVIGPEGSLTLPGVVEAGGKKSVAKTSAESEKMKIAWRYERLGAFEERERGNPNQQLPAEGSGSQEDVAKPFCHTFDLTQRLAIPSSSKPPTYLAPSSVTDSKTSPFAAIVSALSIHLMSNPPTPVRLLIPSLLSPLIYPPSSSQPHHLLTFLHQLRSLLRQHSSVFTVVATWPLALYPSTHPLTRWSRNLCDGVITLRPFPHSFSVDAIDLDVTGGSGGGGTKGKAEEKMQGLIKVLKLPILTEKGISVGVGEDMAFAVGRRRFMIRPFHLPPLESETDDYGGEDGKVESKKLEF